MFRLWFAASALTYHGAVTCLFERGVVAATEQVEAVADAGANDERIDVNVGIHTAQASK